MSEEKPDSLRHRHKFGGLTHAHPDGDEDHAHGHFGGDRGGWGPVDWYELPSPQEPKP